MNTKRAVHDITGTTHHSKLYVINDRIIMSMLRIHVGRNGGLTDLKYQDAMTRHACITQEKVKKKVTDILVTSYSKSNALLLLVTFSKK